MEKTDLLAADNLTCIRGGRLVFRDLSFGLRAGDVLAVEGPNGAGKSSLLRILAGFLQPASGSICYAGAASAEARGQQIGWLGHHDAIKPQMTVRETLNFFTRLYRARPALSLSEGSDKISPEGFGLDRLLDMPCQYLSAGQKKRLALARLTLMQRPLWLMDEPLAALDSSAKKLCAGLIETHCAGGGMVIAATHEPLGVAATNHLTLGHA